jgi:hypothetical protein
MSKLLKNVFGVVKIQLTKILLLKGENGFFIIDFSDMHFF